MSSLTTGTDSEVIFLLSAQPGMSKGKERSTPIPLLLFYFWLKIIMSVLFLVF